jgi:SAM-dependent methyltransferase
VDQLLQATARAESRHFWFRGFRRFVAPLVARALEGCPNPLVLDCGCGTGANVEWLGRYGRTVGFDLTWTGLRIAREAGRRGLVQSSVGAVPFPSAAFDLVTSFDVLYCLEEPLERAAVREMYRVIKPGGAALINVAAMKILTGNHSVLSAELRRYDRPRLRSLLEGAGFMVERMTYTNASLVPFMLAVRGAQRLVGLASPEEAEGEITVPALPVNAALSGALACEAVLTRYVDLPCGSSLLCLARKPA